MVFRFFSRGAPDARYPAAIDRHPRRGNNEAVYSDSHLHLVDLFARDTELFSTLPSPDWRGAVVAHDIAEFERSEELRAKLPLSVAGFGIHPQSVRGDTEEYLSGLAADGRISFIGEAGFDFYGDRPERIRNDENLGQQRKSFEFQLSLALARGLPLLLHSRKGMDLLLGYGREFRRLPALIFHGWPGRIHDARAFLDKGIPAYFSFGTTLLRGARHAIETCAGLPEDRILAETDAPWQPPRGEPWTSLRHIASVSRTVGEIRGTGDEAMRLRLRENFNRAFGLKDQG